MCKPVPDLKVTQFGWGGETASSAAARLAHDVLATLGGVARDLAREEGAAFAEVHDPMMDVMTRGKAKYGNILDVKDGAIALSLTKQQGVIIEPLEKIKK